MQCTSCGFENPEGMSFCGKCGTALTPSCRRCGFANALGFTFCGQCGSPLDTPRPPCRANMQSAERRLQAPTVTAVGEVKARQRGTPQGGVLGPLLLNLFLHYAFDRWRRRELPTCPFARYADDGIVHCRTERQAQWVKQQLAARLRECGLELHPDKTRIVYCKDSNRGGE